jgi:hypothetical protein
MTRRSDTAPSNSRVYARRGPTGDNAYVRDPRPYDAQLTYSRATLLRFDRLFTSALETAITRGFEHPPRRR